MKDKDKAKEIKANNVCYALTNGYPNVYNAAMQMVKWKRTTND